MDRWRLIWDEPRCGAWNMALDEALWRSVLAGEGPPVLRLYAWSAPTVSLGRFQPVGSVCHAARARRGIDLVRRPTGGRAVLHDREVTYSVAAPESALGARGVAATYARIQTALRAGLAVLGVGPELIPGAERGRVMHACCFAVASPADGVVDGRKLIGSAQARRRGVLLQHGSLLLERDAVLWEELFGEGTRAVSLAELSGSVPDDEAVRQALACGFATALDVRWRRSEYRPAELRLAAELASTRYASAG